MNILETVLAAYGLTENLTDIKPFGTGNINHTWVVNSGSEKLILQRINDHVFKKPADIAANIWLISEYLSKNHSDYLFVTPKKTVHQEDFVFLPTKGYFRLFPFVKNSYSIDVVQTTQQAYEAAKQFGRFSKLLSGFPAHKLNITLPDFHNLALRYAQFEKALEEGNTERIRQSTEVINYLKSQRDIAATHENICINSDFKKRVTHHDTKISNVLFDEYDKGLCVIDLDTVMPGYFISDVGDMIRTYLSPVSEEETDFGKIEIRDDYYKAIVEGYLSEMDGELTADEKTHFVYAGKFLIYMQSLRFLTDYLTDDLYYGSKYEGHNFMRAKNQMVLLQKLLEKEKSLMRMVEK